MSNDRGGGQHHGSLPTPDIPVPAETLIALLYSELRSLAEARLRAERVGHTLTPTALVHEAYLRLAREPHLWASRAQFFGAAAEAMKRILIDHHRRKSAAKRGGPNPAPAGCDAVDALSAPDLDRTDLNALEAALDTLQRIDPEAHQVVMLRYFAGLSNEDAADLLNVSSRTVKRRWMAARAWLFQRLAESPAPDHQPAVGTEAP